MDRNILPGDAGRVPALSDSRFSAHSSEPGRLRQGEVARTRLAQHKIRLLTLREVVRYFKENQPTGPRVASGALLRQRGMMSGRYVQVFLDSGDQPIADTQGVVYGRVIHADRVDDDLAAVFGSRGNDLVIFR
jgi:hypothetical protein